MTKIILRKPCDLLEKVLLACREVILRVVSNFGQSLLHGGQYIYQSMPRLLTLWLDYGTEVMEYEKSKSDNVLIGMRKSLQELNKVIIQFYSF